ncbi:uncharacterized protein Z520_03990 [Fonsecaea multimorphosa CBS 102226]|uniref:MmgE/PrpD family protein n=1 Tax=Fonsecaea multimorphosa CBS 102226 TaxID=1442371 RepID=A0A0D2KAY1_9EURO|nr:uncharacterized protein Z520_03990 [Fonsecaea multimorphosa CBS 102226]KIY00305.1 hypothetical protein Z520_03990 [Fonsecaea multimorphosa CBS 102226]OAL27138.1 hypothetical protein AYO22_03769 [Fonsecaea multimorphosa]
MSPSTEISPSSNPTTPSKPDGITGQLCTWITSTKLSEVPDHVIERAKYLILDGFACALVAAHLPWSETAVRGVCTMEPSSAGQCTLIGWGREKKLPPVAATILNSTFIQGFELDDYHSTAPLHSNSLLIPALLASVEAAPSSSDATSAAETSLSTGANFLHAYIVGCEVGPRVGMALHGADLLSRGWHSGAIQGPSATAAAVASLLGLSGAQTEWALGMACTQTGGLMSAQFGSMAKRMQHGFAARNGLFAAFMAKENYTGIQEVYEVPYGGFLSCFSQGANFEPKSLPDELVSGLGSRWELEGIRVKLHAAMAGLHGTIDTVAGLQRSHPELFAPDNLANITKIVTQHARPAFEHGGWIADPTRPLSSVAAQMSIQYAAAAQLVDRQVSMVQFGASRLNRPLLRELMAKTTPTHNKAFDATKMSRWQTVVTVTFADGTEVQGRVDAPRGIKPPVSNEDIVAKWRELTAEILDGDRRDAIERCVLSLEKVPDVRQLAALLEDPVKCPIDV